MILAVRLPQDLADRLAKLSEITDRTKSFYVRKAIEYYLENYEQLYLDERRRERMQLDRVRIHLSNISDDDLEDVSHIIKKAKE